MQAAPRPALLPKEQCPADASHRSEDRQSETLELAEVAIEHCTNARPPTHGQRTLKEVVLHVGDDQGIAGPGCSERVRRPLLMIAR
jgi:hypothetical protein